MGTIQPGSRFGPYEVTGILGSGGMGEVYAARDDRLGRLVALKILPAGLTADPDRLRRFEQEARTSGLLNHPNIVTVLDVGTEAGQPYLVCELLEGETLRDRLGRRPGPPARGDRHCGASVPRARCGARQRDRSPRSEA